MFALFRDGGLGRKEDRPGRLAVCSFLTWRTVTTTDELTERDIRAIGATLEYWKACGEIEYRCRRIAEKLQGVAAP
ncbi:hypothetical protein B1R94_26075 [Mycolicibacterium litorale]|nr:hypothetical protein B1R94_26075 [Mycolicibacterium litorale]